MDDVKRFNEISKRYEAAVRSRRTDIEVARAHVEAAQGTIAIINKQLSNIAGPVGYEVQQERNRLYALRKDATDKLKQRKAELSAALCGGQDKVDETLNGIADKLNI